MFVGTDKQEALRQRLLRLGVRDEDLIERFVRSSGPGGQHVNKTSTAVYLKHLPTGIEVKAQETRSQAINRYLARRLLAERLEARVQGFVHERAAQAAKIRRQKARRSRRSKAKILADKRHEGAKKALRKPPGEE